MSLLPPSPSSLPATQFIELEPSLNLSVTHISATLHHVEDRKGSFSGWNRIRRDRSCHPLIACPFFNFVSPSSISPSSSTLARFIELEPSLHLSLTHISATPHHVEDRNDSFSGWNGIRHDRSCHSPTA
jgi:hypothetical protein